MPFMGQFIITYFGNFCTGFINRLSNVSLPLCSRAIFSRNLANAGLWFVAVRMALFARFTLFTNNVYVSSTVDVENCKWNEKTKMRLNISVGMHSHSHSKSCHTTWTKASPTRCNGSQISNRHRSSSRNCWWMLRIAGTMRKISSTVCASMSDALSCDFNGFKYFCAKKKRQKKRTRKKINNHIWKASMHSYLNYGF